MEALKEDRDCPIFCRRNKQNPYDIYRNEFCKDCQRTKKATEFKRAVQRMWELWMPKESLHLSFENTQTTLAATLAALDLSDDDISVETAEFVGIYHSEKSRYDDSRSSS